MGKGRVRSVSRLKVCYSAGSGKEYQLRLSLPVLCLCWMTQDMACLFVKVSVHVCVTGYKLNTADNATWCNADSDHQSQQLLFTPPHSTLSKCPATLLSLWVMMAMLQRQQE